MKPGKVFLAGCGPGDPSLMTVRVRELLSEVDYVAYDKLIHPNVLKYIGEHTEISCVGYRSHDRSEKPEPIPPELIEKALSGKTVLRLKSGDPGVFGRLSEEIQTLSNLAIPYEVIPGVTAAHSASASLGCSLTRKGISANITILAGHKHLKEGAKGLKSLSGTLALYMARAHLAENMNLLLQNGYDPHIPAVFVMSASLANQKVVSGTIENIADKVEIENSIMPGLLLIGEVYQDYETDDISGLCGKRFVLARCRDQDSKIKLALNKLGADVVEYPIVKSDRIETKIESIIAHADHCLFLSTHSIDRFFECLRDECLDIRRVNSKIHVVGEHLASHLYSYGVQADTILPGTCSRAVLSFSSKNKGSLAIFCDSDEKPNLKSYLAESSFSTQFVALYKKKFVYPHLEHSIDSIILPSSSAAKAFYAYGDAEALKDIPVFVFGPKTKEIAVSHSNHIVETSDDSIESLIDSLNTSRPFQVQTRYIEKEEYASR